MGHTKFSRPTTQFQMGYLERKLYSHDNDSSKDYEHEWQMKLLNQMWQLYHPRQIVPGSIGVIRH